MKKTLGVLCHVSSIPSQYGIGDFGKSSFDFIDFLAENHIGIWQILPLNATNIYNCPYASTCCYSFDEMYVDPQDLLQKGYVQVEDLKILRKLEKTKKVSYSQVKQEKQKLLEMAFTKLSDSLKLDVEKELKTSDWLYDYAYFKTLLKLFNTENFREIPQEYIQKGSEQSINFANENKDQILKYGYFQYVLIQQWQKVREYARMKGVKILGDLPIYPDPNSFDVYAFSDQFLLDKSTLTPLVYGGVPKDEFCENGQNWGTCVYNWKSMKANNYSFMIGKIKKLLTKYDILRLDHFLGYVEHYEWDVDNPKVGKWKQSGGAKFFDVLSKQIDMESIVIEDLGIETSMTTKIRSGYKLKGMCVLQMVMEAEKNHRYLPTALTDDCLYYLGTHDNNTFIGFLKGLPAGQKADFCKLMQIENKNNKQILVDSIKQMLNSKSETVILQIQDLLLQDGKSRMNVPGHAVGCWEYKMPKGYNGKARKTLSKIGWQCK